MKKCFITKIPDKAGAFLKASEIIAKNNGNIIRVNYNRNLDVHTLFIDVYAEKDDMAQISQGLEKIGYLTPLEDEQKKVILINLHLKDEPGTLKPILKILTDYNINISYMNSQENDSGYQHFKMGIFITDTSVTKEVLDKISEICPLSILDYDVTDRLLDNTVFYLDFSNTIRKLINLNQQKTNEFLVNSNMIMQNLEERGEPPHKTFEYIYRFAEAVSKYRGKNYKYRKASKQITPNINLHIIEPPCGSNTFIFENDKELMFIDSGFSCFESELFDVVERIIPNYENMKKSLYLSHGDIDHSGLAHLFDRVYTTQSNYNNFLHQHQNKDDFREMKLVHRPYGKISKIISNYEKPNLNSLIVIGEKKDDDVLSFLGKFEFMGLSFDVYEGYGGHIQGETIIICPEHKIAFTGDNLVNIKGFSKEQREFNALAPFLMTNVDVDYDKAANVRATVIELAKGMLICPGHGAWYES
ncbi:MAG: ACT domain-containing protein [Christensenellaceae bacterium]|nr:ACT domain-containing protein [Christensenellaceae bacterium]